MKHLRLTEHNKNCKQKKKIQFKKHGYIFPCQTNYIVLYIKSEYFIIEHTDCNTYHHHHLDQKEYLIKEIQKALNLKKQISYNVNRSICNYGNWMNQHKRNTLYNDIHSEINSIYEDNTKKEYFFTTDYYFGDFIFNRIEHKKEYEKAIDYITDNNLLFLEKEINNLYKYNLIPQHLESKEFIYKTTKELITNIKTLSNE